MRSANTITVTIARLGGEPTEVSVPTDSTVAQALEKANITLGAGESVYYKEEVASLDALLDDGDHIVIVQNKKGGAAKKKAKKVAKATAKVAKKGKK